MDSGKMEFSGIGWLSDPLFLTNTITLASLDGWCGVFMD